MVSERVLRAAKATPGDADTNGHARRDDAWDNVVPLGSLPEPAPFPLEALPAPLADYVRQVAWATNSPPDFVGVPLLALAAGCLGGARTLAVQRDYLEPCTVFAAVVGLPGTGKSPALKKVAWPLDAEERRLVNLWKGKAEEWEGKEAGARSKEKPALQRLLVDDTTTEALCRTLHANQRGLTMVADELAGLVASMNQYKEGKGNDLQVYQKIWAGATIRVDRKGNPDALPLIVPHPSLSIIGGVNPDLVESFMVDQRGRRVDNGWLDRFLVSYPRDLPAVEENRRAIEPEALACWMGAVKWLLAVEQWRDDDGNLRPKVVGLSASGWDAWVEFTRAHAAEVNDPSFPAYRRGPWAKLRGYCARLALVLYFLEIAVTGVTPYREDVDAAAVMRAALLTDYFKAHNARVGSLVRSDPRLAEAACVLGWLRRNLDVSQFSRRDAYMNLRHSFASPDGLDSPLGLLAQHGYVRPLDMEDRPGPGRKPSQKYEVNPKWKRAESVP